jgi:riboflavin kinase/FMN adenylyltransferase
VYAAEAQLGPARHRAAVNIGHRPTVHAADPRLHVEAHLLDFNGDLYARTLELVFLQQLRPEQKFPTPAALRAQIAKDITQARAVGAPSHLRRP